MTSSVDKKNKINEACKTGQEFATLFYETFDTRRHLLSNLYMDSGNLVWNGSAFTGKEEISKFYQNLPSSETCLWSIDAQPVADQFSNGQTTVLVMASGSMYFKDKRDTPFAESFILTAQGTVWKIVTASLRFFEPVSEAK